MRRKLTTLLFLLALGGVALVGCDQVALDEAESAQAVDVDVAFNQIPGFEAALVSAYDRLQTYTHYGQYFMLYPAAMADNAGFLQGANRYNAVTRNQQGSHLLNDIYEGGTDQEYLNVYDAINITNNVITKIQGFEIVPEPPNPQEIRDRIRGQAHFLRALNYFDLVRTHAYEPGREVDGFDAGVILRTSPTETPADADFRARSTNQEVYDLIVSDLETAASLLEGKALPKSRANAAAAYGLLSRVHLYLENWGAAEQAATNAINAAGSVGASMMSASDFPAAWQAETLPGTLFELKMTAGQDGDATTTNESLPSLSYAGRCANAPASAGYRTFNFQVVPTEDLIQTYPAGDARRTLVDTLSACGEVIMTKFRPNPEGSNSPARVPIVRLAEVYLNRAEARAEQGNLYGANSAESDLNMIRTNRGISAVSSGLSQSAFVDEVLLERRRELAFEGHRFFDLKRRAMDIPKPQPNVPATELPYDDFRILAEFPTPEVRSNPQLEQNPGY